MSCFDVKAWLRGLAAALRADLSTETIREWLEELSTWPLSAEQWGGLKAEARRRFPRFPSIAELYELRLELFRPADQPGSPPVWELVEAPDGCRRARRPQRGTP